VKRVDLVIAEQTPSLSDKQIENLHEEENKMAASDRLVFETAEKKNAVESYVYDMRNKINESLATFAVESARNLLIKKLDETETWLYGEGENETKSVYVKKLDELKEIGDPIARRKYEYDSRYEALLGLRNAIEHYRVAATSNDVKHEHIEAQEKTKVLDKCAELEKQINEQMAKQDLQPKHIDPLITCADILKKKSDLERFSNDILNKPKPEPPKQPPTEDKKEEKKEEKKDDKKEGEQKSTEQKPSENTAPQSKADPPPKDNDKMDTTQ